MNGLSHRRLLAIFGLSLMLWAGYTAPAHASMSDAMGQMMHHAGYADPNPQPAGIMADNCCAGCVSPALTHTAACVVPPPKTDFGITPLLASPPQWTETIATPPPKG